MWPNPQLPADLVTFTKKSLMENFIFCAVLLEKYSTNQCCRRYIDINRMIKDFPIQISSHLKFETTNKLIVRSKASMSKYQR